MGPVVARAVRWISIASLFAILAQAIILLPFLFDSPRTPPLVVLGIIFTAPLSFILSERRYQDFLSRGAIAKATLLAGLPLIWIGILLGTAQVVGTLKPRQYVHTTSTIIGTGNSRLFIDPPENCELEVFRTKFEIHGTWRPDADKIRFVCDATLASPGSLSITEALSISGVEITANGHREFLEKKGNFKIYHVTRNNKVVAEITEFKGYDGYIVSVMRWTASSNPTYRVVSRRLDDAFELKYGIDPLMADGEDMMNVDRQVAEYVRSFVRRTD